MSSFEGQRQQQPQDDIASAELSPENSLSSQPLTSDMLIRASSSSSPCQVEDVGALPANEQQTGGTKRKSTRARKRVEQTKIEPLSYREEKQIRLALDKSKDEVIAPIHATPTEALSLYPTEEEFLDPIAYIVKNKDQIAAKGGIAKIIPPKGWNCPLELDVNRMEISTKEQKINTLGEGYPYGTGSDYDVESYQEMADEFKQQWNEKLAQRGEDISDPKTWERAYWRIVEGGEQEEVVVEYGNDVSTEVVGGGFPRMNSEQEITKMWESEHEKVDFSNREYYARTEWNLSNIARARGSILGQIKDAINGINVPWLYFGMLFSTFSWHVEDNWFYSINYSHKGGIKLWYGISPAYQFVFDQEMKRNMPVRFAQEPELLSDIVTMLNPQWLIHRNIPVCYAHQNPGEFIVTLPGAYHGGFSLGFNIGEAVNFAPIDWIGPGRLCRDVYRAKRRKPVIAHDKIVWSLARKMRQAAAKGDRKTIEFMLAELGALLKQERDVRAHCEKDGISFQVRMPEEDETSDESDIRRSCVYCNQPCSLHAVVCECNPTRVACGLHHKSACSCPPAKKCLAVWRTMDELQRILDSIKQSMGSD